MITCHACQHENPTRITHCEKCNAPLDGTQEVALLEDDSEQSTTENNKVGDKTVPIKSKDKQMGEKSQADLLDETILQPVVEEETENDTDSEQSASASEEVITDDSTHATAIVPNMDDEDGLLHIGSVRFQGDLLLRHEETGTVFRIENQNLEEAVIGRFNSRTGYRPTVDLSAVNGKNLGVSRRHATINQRGELIFVTDHNSLNGTYLNGQRLVPEQSRVMRDSDSLRIGHVTLLVSFEDSEKSIT